MFNAIEVVKKNRNLRKELIITLVFLSYMILALITSFIISFLVNHFNLERFIPKLDNNQAILIFIFSFSVWIFIFVRYYVSNLIKEANEIVEKSQTKKK